MSPVRTLEDLVASSPSLASLAAALGRAAESEASILVLGEPGTGRTTLARVLHGASRRAAGPLVEVDPGVIPSTLFESEFFGYREGAFTGAERSVDGRIERSSGGTLILDHVEELPLTSQPKLLRLLAEQRYSPLGGSERDVDVRFIAVGSHELPRRVEQGAFREDLYYRLEVLAFLLPPLRSRKQDLAALIASVLEDLKARYGRPNAELTDDAWSWMTEYAWPGNLRQVRNVLERQIILGDDRPLDPERPESLAESRPRTLLELEREAIERTLAYTRGHQGMAAELLGISRKALWEKRKRFGIP